MLDKFFQYLAYISDHNVFSFGGTPVYHISQACSETSPYWLFSAFRGFARARFFNLLDVSSRSDFLLSRNRSGCTISALLIVIYQNLSIFSQPQLTSVPV